VKRPCFKLEIPYPQPLAGVDEAGCAPLAGPVVAAAVVLDREKFPRGIDDSKKLDLETREALYGRLQKVALCAVGIASVEEIDQINIYWARMLAMQRAVEALGLEPAWVLVDGNATPRWQRPSRAIVAGYSAPPTQFRPRARADGSNYSAPDRIIFGQSLSSHTTRG
jgi:ribonuclease HII